MSSHFSPVSFRLHRTHAEKTQTSAEPSHHDDAVEMLTLLGTNAPPLQRKCLSQLWASVMGQVVYFYWYKIEHKWYLDGNCSVSRITRNDTQL